MTTVLIVEDEAAMLEEVLMLLRFEGYEALGAANGVDGVRLAREHLPDIIVSDIMLPKLDGYGVLSALQNDEKTRHIPFIFLTAKSDNLHLRHGMALGADDYVTKPFTRDELLSAIRTRLAERQVVAADYERKLDELRESLTLILPHELRTPLTALVGFTELLMTDSDRFDGDTIAEMAAMITESGERLEHHLANFWLYAQLSALSADRDSRQALYDERCTEPGAVVAATVGDIAQRAGRSANVVLNAVDAAVVISRDNLTKVVEEIIDNAFKFSEPGTTVTVTAALRSEWYELCVQDRGRGMASEQIKQAGAYMQFGRSTFEQQGAGLGLAIVRAIAELHDGELEITSTPGHGCQVTVRLPVAADAQNR